MCQMFMQIVSNIIKMGIYTSILDKNLYWRLICARVQYRLNMDFYSESNMDLGDFSQCNSGFYFALTRLQPITIQHLYHVIVQLMYWGKPHFQCAVQKSAIHGLGYRFAVKVWNNKDVIIHSWVRYRIQLDSYTVEIPSFNPGNAPLPLSNRIQYCTKQCMVALYSEPVMWYKC